MCTKNGTANGDTETMTESEFRAELKNPHGGYLFFGEEDYLKYTYSKEVRKAVTDGAFDEFNHIVIYGEEYSAQALSSAISSLPMMAEKKLVEVRGLDFNSLKKDDVEKMTDVLSDLDSHPDTVLIMRADSSLFNPGRLPKAPSEIYRTLAKYLTPVEFQFPQSARLQSWIMRHFAEWKIDLDPSLCRYLVEVCGHSMWTLSNEIEKLCAYAVENNLHNISESTVDLVCCKTVEYDDFQLTNALLDYDKELVFETLRRQKITRRPPMSILSAVIKVYTEMFLINREYMLGMSKQEISSSLKIHEFRVGKYLAAISRTSRAKIERAAQLCRDADIASKSASNVTSYIAPERLIASVCALMCR